MSLIYRTYN